MEESMTEAYAVTLTAMRRLHNAEVHQLQKSDKKNKSP
jgi:hypothetical protein